MSGPDSGLRLTPQRRAVLDVLVAATDHPTAHEVFARVQETSPGIGFATVYRALGRLVDSGQALALSLGDGAARYDANVGRHDHLVCDRCGRAVDIDAGIPDTVAAGVARRTGFRVTAYSLQFRGLCPECRSTADPSTRSPKEHH